jgi:hypothetical protein
MLHRIPASFTDKRTALSRRAAWIETPSHTARFNKPLIQPMYFKPDMLDAAIAATKEQQA